MEYCKILASWKAIEGTDFSQQSVSVCWRLLSLGLEGKVIRSQDLSSLILMVAGNPQGHNLAWDFVKTNWDTLVQKWVQQDADSVNDPVLHCILKHLHLLSVIVTFGAGRVQDNFKFYVYRTVSFLPITTWNISICCFSDLQVPAGLILH